MRKIKLLPVLLTAAVIALSSLSAPTDSSAGVNVQINGYLPAPPGVHVYMGGGRPYYVREHRRVYMERDRRHRRHRPRHERDNQGYRDHGRGEGRGNGHGR